MKTYVRLLYLAEFFVEWEIFRTKFVEKNRGTFNFQYPLFFENHAVCEIMWKNVVELGRPQMAVQYGACALHTG
jgi:hypothetical protein